MTRTQYIGARYVPTFAEPMEWSSSRTYEPLTIVIYNGNSYTSKQSVPTGVAITNTQFWAATGNYNAQIEQYREETAEAVDIALDAKDIATVNRSVTSSTNSNPDRIYRILKTWVDNVGKMFYGGATTQKQLVSLTPVYSGEEITGFSFQNVQLSGSGSSAKFPIVCVTLVQLALMGITFNNSRAVSGTVSGSTLSGGNNVPSSGFGSLNLATKNAMKYWGLTPANGCIYTAEFAKMLYDAGLLHEFTSEDHREAQPGDIIFYAPIGTNVAIDEVNNRIDGLNHCDIFMGWAGGGARVITTDNNAANPAIKYNTWAMGSGTSQYWQKAGKFYARIPAGAPNPVPAIIGQVFNHTGAATVTLDKAMVDGLYTVIVRPREAVPTALTRFNFRPFVGSSNVAAAVDSNSYAITNLPHSVECDGSYKFVVQVMPGYNVDGFRIGYSGTSTAVPCDVEVYDGIV